MFRFHSTLCAALVVASFAHPAQAQLTSSGGPTRALAAGGSLHGGAPNGFDELHVAPPRPGTASVHLGGTPPFSPDYSLSAMFPAYADIIEVDAYDSGNALIPEPDPFGADPNAPNVGGWTWLEVLVSVRNDAVGLPGSFIEKRRLLPSGRTTPGADVIGYMLEGSVGIAPSLVGATVLEQKAERFGFVNDEDFDAFDYGIGVIHFAGSNNRNELFTNDIDCYFSLSPQCISAVNARAVALGTQFAQVNDADAASIFHISWTGTSWSEPSTYLKAGALDLDAASDNLDALAVDGSRGTVVFSTQLKPGISQLRFLDHDGAGNVTHLSDLGDGSGGTATLRIGSNDETDDIDAACVVDPEAGTHASHLGTALAPILPLHEFGLSITRSMQPSSDGTTPPEEMVHFLVTGSKEAPLGGGWVHYLVQLGQQYAVPLPPYDPSWLYLFTLPVPAGTDELVLSLPNGSSPSMTPLLFQCLYSSPTTVLAGASWANMVLVE